MEVVGAALETEADHAVVVEVALQRPGVLGQRHLEEDEGSR